MLPDGTYTGSFGLEREQHHKNSAKAAYRAVGLLATHPNTYPSYPERTIQHDAQVVRVASAIIRGRSLYAAEIPTNATPEQIREIRLQGRAQVDMDGRFIYEIVRDDGLRLASGETIRQFNRDVAKYIRP